MTFVNRILVLILAAGVTLTGSRMSAQGCVAAHSNQRVIDGLMSTDTGGEVSSKWEHNLTIDIGYRVFNSNKYFVGSNEIARPTAIRNHQNIFDVGIEYVLSQRWSVIADVPVFNGSRNQLYPPTGVFRVSGLGDISVGAQRWLFRPPTENGGNVAVSLSLKIPTGQDDATGQAVSGGKTITATADPSLQPGDGGWGFTVGSQAYKTLWHTASLYSQGSYLFNPEDTNGVASFRTQPGQSVISVTDQYLYRGGISQGVPKLKGVALSLGIRGEGVPVRDLLGSSNGFRRPGKIISLDPGLIIHYKRESLYVNGPWAIYRDRPPSVPEIQYHTANGDAFFSDYTVVASWAHHF
jgi:hypothetical protein